MSVQILERVDQCGNGQQHHSVWLDTKGLLTVEQCVCRFLAQHSRSGNCTVEDVTLGILEDQPPKSWEGRSLAQCKRSVAAALKRAKAGYFQRCVDDPENLEGEDEGEVTT